MAIRRSRGIGFTPSSRLSEAIRKSAGTPWYSQSTEEAARIFSSVVRRGLFAGSDARWRRSGRLAMGLSGG